MTDDNIQRDEYGNPQESLEALANRIKVPWGKLDTYRVTTGLLLLQARQRVDSGEAGEGVTWEQWCRENITERKLRDIRKLLAIAKADDPEAAAEEERQKAREGMARTRERQRSNVRPVNNGGTVRDINPMAERSDLVADYMALVKRMTPSQVTRAGSWLADAYPRETPEDGEKSATGSWAERFGDIADRLHDEQQAIYNVAFGYDKGDQPPGAYPTEEIESIADIALSMLAVHDFDKIEETILLWLPRFGPRRQLEIFNKLGTFDGLSPEAQREHIDKLTAKLKPIPVVNIDTLTAAYKAMGSRVRLYPSEDAPLDPDKITFGTGHTVNGAPICSWPPYQHLMDLMHRASPELQHEFLAKLRQTKAGQNLAAKIREAAAHADVYPREEPMPIEEPTEPTPISEPVEQVDHTKVRAAKKAWYNQSSTEREIATDCILTDKKPRGPHRFVDMIWSKLTVAEQQEFICEVDPIPLREAA